jgi:BASS family bile acid:Na+ symporter
LTNFALGEFLSERSDVHLDFWTAVWTLGKLTVLPIGAGMIVRVYRKNWAERAVEVFRRITFIILMLIVTIAVMGALRSFAENFATAGLMAICLNVFAMTAGYLLARAGRLSALQSMTITFEVGVQNLTLAALVILAMLQRPDLFIFTFVYSLVMKVTAFSLLALAPRIISRSKKTD